MPPATSRILTHPVLGSGNGKPRLEIYALGEPFCRLKDFRRVRTRYDNLAANFQSAIALAAAVGFWL